MRGYLTGSIDLVRALRRPLRAARLQDELARARPGEPLTRRATTARRPGRRDAALALRPAGAALRRRAAPLPALAAARLRPRAPPRRRACTCSCAA